MRRSDRWAFGILGAGVVAILGGIELAGRLDDAPAPPAPVAEFCPEKAGGAARSDTRYREDAAPYQGAGPHPVALGLRYAGDVEVPDGWDAARPQLVACLYREGPARPQVVRTCLYSYVQGVPVDPEKAVKVALMRTGYTVQVYEARTARPVGRASVAGGGACPARHAAGSGGAVAEAPDAAGLRAALRPYVERAAGG
ncbi:hypothetical protein [Actinomadura parmotrematis]|uniref:DUF3558 domain-containing protein n=1 Tax=Actinomadura parmotrematis TaxID=2864039 RepID=A0ABS7FNX2_9ACTN|nr:hypothetical protein [Actinomadura parmotrematis]MBW8481695.1 hypothetical protein [Actinomadura parmotrematis]